jgi:3-phenylpropionate/trans-cinnamate dioxygenase ferredoxin reductase subunit
MGRIAGLNMTGRSETYSHLPYFYSDLFDLGFEAVGEIDSRLEIVADWETKFRKGVIYCLRNNRVRGVLLWNTFGRVDAARALIGSQQRVPASMSSPVGRGDRCHAILPAARAAIRNVQLREDI